MNSRWTALFAIVVGLGVALLPIAHRVRNDSLYRNFRVVDPGKLYRSGQMHPDGFARTVREHGIKTVVSLRDTKDSAGVHEDQEEMDYCSTHGIAFHRQPPAGWTRVNGVAEADKNIEEFIRLMEAPATPKPVLVHCFAGIHRTGMHVAIYRMEFNGWTAQEAIEEMRSMGTPRTTFAANVLEYLETHRLQRR